MRRILIESARRRNADKRGGGMVRCELHEEDVTLDAEDFETLLSLDEALTKLAIGKVGGAARLHRADDR